MSQTTTTATNQSDDGCEHPHVRQISEHDVECIDCGTVGA